ncbi:hypothetical protein RB195_003609 [Necator americanus]|uniref:Nematode fatty acid retinoid binding protein n=1 Tax=Necator americanus TaxID=51031 RepID=A0ABR1DPF0_NECAM
MLSILLYSILVGFVVCQPKGSDSSTAQSIEILKIVCENSTKGEEKLSKIEKLLNTGMTNSGDQEKRGVLEASRMAIAVASILQENVSKIPNQKVQRAFRGIHAVMCDPNFPTLDAGEKFRKIQKVAEPLSNKDIQEFQNYVEKAKLESK